MTQMVGAAAGQARSLRESAGWVLRWLPAVILALVAAGSWGTVLAGGMPGVITWHLMVMLVGPVLGLLTLLASLVYALVKRRASKATWVTRFVALVLLWPAAWNLGVARVRYPASLESTQPSATVRVPFTVPMRVLWGGNELEYNYHAAYPDQRWAYDLTVDPQQLGSDKLEDYGCWGKDLVAPAAGRVQLAHDGEPDVPPGPPSNSKAPFGNFVSLELSSGTFLVLGHLQQGSILVRTGDQVTEGQALARCGNSGNTSEPHLHLHHQRQPLVLGKPPGLAEGLPLYFRDHDGAPMPTGGVRVVDRRAEPLSPPMRHVGPTLAVSAAKAQP
jgi:hypothetical protein